MIGINKTIYAISFLGLSGYIYSMELSEQEIKNRYNQEIKAFEKKIKENLEKEHAIAQQALNNIQKRKNQMNRLLTSAVESKVFDRRYTMAIKELESAEKSIAYGLSSVNEKLANIPRYITSMQHEILSPEYVTKIRPRTLLEGDKFLTDLTKEYQMSIAGFAKNASQPLLTDEKVKEEPMHYTLSSFYRIGYPSSIDNIFDTMIRYELAKIDAKVLNIPVLDLQFYIRKLTDIIGLPAAIWETPMYAAKEPGLWQKLVNWWYGKPSVTMGLTQIPQKQAEIPTPSMRQGVPSAWQQSKQWAGQLKTRAKSALEKKAERYQAQERYIPAGWVVDPWQ